MNKQKIYSKVRSKRVQDLLKKYNISHLYLFGSHVRGSATPTSDIDFLYETSARIGYSDFLKLKKNLENIFEKNIDIVDRKFLNKHYAPHIEKEKEKII